MSSNLEKMNEKGSVFPFFFFFFGGGGGGNLNSTLTRKR